MHHGVKNVMGIFISQLALYPEHIVGQGIAVWVGAGRLELDQFCSCYTGVLLSWVKCGLKHIAVCYEQASLVSCNGLPVFINRSFLVKICTLTNPDCYVTWNTLTVVMQSPLCLCPPPTLHLYLCVSRKFYIEE